MRAIVSMKNTLTIYHNPRCSKSRQTLALIEEAGITPNICLYLDTPPSKKELNELIKKLAIQPRDLLRKGEDAYKEENLGDKTKTDEELINAMLKHPKLIERPIVVKENTAIIGRPPENVLPLLK